MGNNIEDINEFVICLDGLLEYYLCCHCITYNIWGKSVCCRNSSSYNNIFNLFYILSLSVIFPIGFLERFRQCRIFVFNFFLAYWGNKPAVVKLITHLNIILFNRFCL